MGVECVDGGPGGVIDRVAQEEGAVQVDTITGF